MDGKRKDTVVLEAACTIFIDLCPEGPRPGATEQAHMDTPWLIDGSPPWYEDRLWGYVVVHRDPPMRYWTGLTPRWSCNPRRALVDAVAPWGSLGFLEALVPGGRCVRVLLEDEVTMLPLRHWPCV